MKEFAADEWGHITIWATNVSQQPLVDIKCMTKSIALHQSSLPNWFLYFPVTVQTLSLHHNLCVHTH